MTKKTKTATKPQLSTTELEKIISVQFDCGYLLISAINEHAESVGVEGFRLESSFNERTEHCCFLETPDAYHGPLYQLEGAQAVMALLGMIAQAQATQE